MKNYSELEYKMELSKYIHGNGADVSENENIELSNYKNAKISHFYLEPNNLYTLKSQFGFESLDFIFSKNLINSTKFYRILLKEWFNFCKVGGCIIISLKENKMLNISELKKEIGLLFQNKAKIAEELRDKENAIFVIKKTKPLLEFGDEISKWSFGIVTNGDRDEMVDKEIASIEQLNIPHYEILVCGKYNGKYLSDKNVKFIFFENPPGKGWITRKKNIICENAKFENIVVTHDKFIFSNDWYNGMKEYGNYFEVLSCVTHNIDSKRAGDWITFGGKWEGIPSIGLLDYKDWDKYVFIDGGFYILKKSVWRKNKWDETLFYMQGRPEDLILGEQWYNLGILTRFNPYSKVISLKWNHGNLKEYKLNKNKLGGLKSGHINSFIYKTKMLIKVHVLRRDPHYRI